MAMTLATDQAIADVVAYITTLPPTHANLTLDGDPRKGAPLYNCASPAMAATRRAIPRIRRRAWRVLS
jgi:hypothetical protein